MKKRLYKILGVIPARGGSKSVPRKNIALVAGKPLIAYTIEEALKSKLLTRVIVSSEDQEIIEISKRHGAEVPFVRPKTLATDRALAVPTIQHAVREVEKMEGSEYDFVVMLQPTTPLREARHIDDCLKKLIQTGADSVISVLRVWDKHPYRMKIIKRGRLCDYEAETTENMPRQDLPAVYLRNGAVYACKRNVLMNDNSFKGRDSRPYIMSEEESVNIDSVLDLRLADIILKEKMHGKSSNR